MMATATTVVTARATHQVAITVIASVAILALALVSIVVA